MIRTFIDLAPSARRHAQGWLSRSSRQSRSSLGLYVSKVEPPAAHRHAAAAHPNARDPPAGAVDLDVEDARTSDLEALLAADPYVPLARHEPRRDEIRSERDLSY